jgi:nucleoside-diphosphate-sugar epimerase
VRTKLSPAELDWINRELHWANFDSWIQKASTRLVARVLITGATGLIGRTLCSRLAEAGYQLRVILRNDRELPSYIAEKVVVGDICSVTDWSSSLAEVDVVVHAAARAHVLESHKILREPDKTLRCFTDTNVTATERLAQAAAQEGVSRFVYLSSIKVNGEESGELPFDADCTPAPQDAYGKSKLAAELAIRTAATVRGMEFAIVRPPLVYGPGVQANFLRLMQWVDHERFLPLAAVENQRSLVSVWNLSELILILLRHRSANGKVWLVADDETLSTPELIRRLATALHRRARLLAVPVRLLRFAAAIAGREREISRLCGSLAVDCSRTREMLGWRPTVTVDEGLARTAAWYRSS